MFYEKYYVYMKHCKCRGKVRERDLHPSSGGVSVQLGAHGKVYTCAFGNGQFWAHLGTGRFWAYQPGDKFSHLSCL